jgi:hypothetical protein
MNVNKALFLKKKGFIVRVLVFFRAWSFSLAEEEARLLRTVSAQSC